MNNILVRSFLVALVALFSLQAIAAEKPVFTKNGAAIRGYDTVAYFTLNKPVKGQKSFSVSYRGVNWHFSSEQNKQLFLANPKKYAPQYGGHCAFAMANDNLVSVDPKAFTIVDDKLYLNYSLAVRKRWVKDIPGYIADADENWVKF